MARAGREVSGAGAELQEWPLPMSMQLLKQGADAGSRRASVLRQQLRISESRVCQLRPPSHLLPHPVQQHATISSGTFGHGYRCTCAGQTWNITSRIRLHGPSDHDGPWHAGARNMPWQHSPHTGGALGPPTGTPGIPTCDYFRFASCFCNYMQKSCIRESARRQSQSGPSKLLYIVGTASGGLPSPSSLSYHNLRSTQAEPTWRLWPVAA